jgi:predicted RND superfamily exporter protein
VDFERIDEALRGAVSVDVLVDSREPGGIYEPELLHRIERIMNEAPALPAQPLFIEKSSSIVDIVKETHQALNDGDPAMHRIPETRQTVAQELLLFEDSGSEDIAELVDSEYRRARITLRLPSMDAFLYPPLLDDIEALVAKRLDGHADFELTGLTTLLARIFEALMESMVRSYTYALLVVTLLMMLLLGSLKRGLVSMVPNLLPVLAVLGVMGWVGWALDPTTIVVGAMVIGLAVDDTIHFMHKFQGYFKTTGNLSVAVRETLRTTGSALLFTSLVIASGFLIFGMSEMANTRAFGLLAAMAAVVAFVADLLVTPAMLSLVERRRQSGRVRAATPTSPADLVEEGSAA